MANESEVKNDPQPEAKPAAEAKPEVKAEAPAAAAEAKPEVKPEVKDPTAWKDARIAELTGKLKAAGSKINELETKTKAPASSTAPLDPTADFNSRVAAAAAQQVAVQTFNDKCNAEAKIGRTKYGEAEFNSRLGELKKIVNAEDPASLGAYNQLLLAALDTDKMHDVVFQLGGNLNEAHRILSLSATKMAIELERMVAKAPPEDPSNLPKPITPVDTRGVRHDQIDPADPERGDKMDTAEWMRRRNAQVSAANEARGR